jgi:hypothetical protein
MKTAADLAELLSSEKALTRILSNELERTGDATDDRAILNKRVLVLCEVGHVAAARARTGQEVAREQLVKGCVGKACHAQGNACRDSAPAADGFF